MSVPVKKLSDLGKPWVGAPAWQQRVAASHQPQTAEAEQEAPLVPEVAARPAKQPVDFDEEFRRQYQIWRGDNPTRQLDRKLPPMSPLPPLPPIENTKLDMRRGARVVFMVGGAALAAFYVAGVLPNLNRSGLEPAADPQAETTVMKVASADAAGAKTARLEVPPMPPAAKQPEPPKWPDPVSVKPAQENAPAAQSAPVAAAQPAAAPVAEPPVKPARAIPPEELELMLKRGEEFIATGDLAAARLVLERAARAQNARAAFALASTYDPVVLEKMKVVGTPGDLELAIMWYERAKQYGSKDAGQRLTALAGRM
ncbi:MAG TPA: hypothetical protein VHA55_08100 [Pseudorhodoplanes sp.]|jgi:hypothetical protein|nr:hypothetical protein [Pseudorhodoplanes sp.]